MKALRFFFVMVLAVSPICSARSAREILADSGAQGGLVVHVGCGEGRLTAALRASDRYLVHGVDEDAAKVARAREYIRSKGLYGAVSVDVFDGQRLPYSDDLVNLVVSEEPGGVSMDEVIRVLRPGGVACVKGENGEWRKVVKPWPEDIDDWSHFLHDASNNAVAADTQVGPPRRIRWVCGPLWARSHEFTSSLCAMVSGGGRIYYFFDEGLTGVTTSATPERWRLIARDAFNGVLLWKRDIENWGAAAWNSKALRSIPPTVPRRLVAAGDRICVTLGYDAPVSVLDGATGQVLQTYEATEGADEIRYADDVVLVRRKNGRLAAYSIESGNLLWQSRERAQRTVTAMKEGRVYYQDGGDTVCLRAEDGKPLWRINAGRALSPIVALDEIVLIAGKQLRAISAETGEELWSASVKVPRNEIFVAQGCVWHWSGSGFAGRDIATGDAVKRVDASEVFTPGHHVRCYQSKATEKYIVTPERGAEFVSITGAEHTQNDWVRGPCRYGIMPCNGLLYAPPNPCFCYPGVKITGFNALAPALDSGGARPEESAKPRLRKGPAYGKVETEAAPTDEKDWLSYRHDPRRTGATDQGPGQDILQSWKTRIGGKLTPPVSGGGRVYVAAEDEHTVYALSMSDGGKIWHFTAGARIDSPPSLYGGFVVFGCADGYAYCLRRSDGAQVWRFRAAPVDERIVAFGQLESPWRVHGSVLIKGGTAYFTAGRSSYLDGGVDLFAVDVATGELKHRAKVDSWTRTREDAVGKPFVAGYYMEGTHSDLLVSQGDYIYLGQMKFDLELNRLQTPYVLEGGGETVEAMDQTGKGWTVADENPNTDYEKHQRDWLERTQKSLLEELHTNFGSHNLGDRRMGLHVLSTGGFLDDSWFNRTYWMYAKTWPGYYLGHRAAKTGHLLVVGPQRTYAVNAYPSRNLQSPLFTPGQSGYVLIADDNENEPVLDSRTRGTTKGWGWGRKAPPVWHKWVPVRVRAMTLVGNCLYAAGPPDVVDDDDPYGPYEGRKGGILLARAAGDGRKLGEYRLESPPVFDGMAVAKGNLLISCLDGSVVCMGSP